MQTPEPLPPLKKVLWLGAKHRCPCCGKGPIYKGWLKLHDNCSACGLKYLQDQGDLWAYLLLFDRALFIFPLIVLIYFRLYVPSSAWFYVLAVVLLFLFIYTLPHRNGMALGADYYIRKKWGDLSDASSPQKPDDTK